MQKINVITAQKNEVSQKACDLLKSKIDGQTLLLLSGGTSPDILYKLIAQDATLSPGAVALIDERFGIVMHDNSNEKMITETGLVEYFVKQRVPIHMILEEGIDMDKTAADYDQTLKTLFNKYPKRVAIMGIGADGHTSGIKPGLEYDHSKLVVAYDDKDGSFGKRITTTFEALDQIDEFIVLVFGESKKEILKQMRSGIDQNIMPAGFFNKTSSSVSLFTDISFN